ncbi:unnamed protein product, partial [Mesorhabditis spiculigera]
MRPVPAAALQLMKRAHVATNVAFVTKREKEEISVPSHYGSDGEQSTSTAFKNIFKKFKRRVPPPDFSDVVDPTLANALKGIAVERLGTKDFQVSADDAELLGLKPIEEWRITTIKGREGLYILPSIIREEAHLKWLQRCFQYAETPNITNLTAHDNTPKTDFLRSAAKSLRWTTLGVDYNWTTKEYPLEGRPLPIELKRLATIVCDAIGVGKMEADAAIVNYYPPKSTLSPHQDRSERDLTRALVSVSFGQSAVYLTGGTSLDDPILPIWLHSGDVLVMHADQRLVYHAVPCIVSTRKFDGATNKGKAEENVEEDKELLDYANTSRVNITIRQVNE